MVLQAKCRHEAMRMVGDMNEWRMIHDPKDSVWIYLHLPSKPTIHVGRYIMHGSFGCWMMMNKKRKTRRLNHLSCPFHCQASCPSAPRSACWHGATARAPATTLEPLAIAPPVVATPAITTPALTPAASASATSSAPALEMVEVQTVMLPKSIIVVWGLKQTIMNDGCIWMGWMCMDCRWW